MAEQTPTALQDLKTVVLVMIGEHYPDHEASVGVTLFGADYLATELSQLLLDRLDAWRGARETAPRAIAECVLLMLPHLHSQLCRTRRKADHCAVDVAFCASIVSVIAAWQMQSPLLAKLDPAIASALAVNDVAVRCDRIEVAVREMLAPPRITRELRSIRPGCHNNQVNTPITNASDDEYDRNRTYARHIKFACTTESMSWEVTAEFAHPADGSRPPLDEAVDGAIFRTTAMVVFTDGGGLGTGETLRLAGDLLIPTLVLRASGENADRPLQARREGRHAIRMERFFDDQDDVVAHVQTFLSTYEVQIERRHNTLLEWASLGDEISWIRDAIDSLDPAIFETSNIGRDWATFVASDPVYWFQAPPSVRREVERLVSADRPRDEQRPIVSSAMNSSSDVPATRQTERALRNERMSLENLLTIAEVYGWTYEVVSRLLVMHGRTQARQTATTSHILPPMQEKDWERLYAETYGS